MYVAIRSRAGEFPEILGVSTTLDRAIARCHQAPAAQQYELQVVEVAVDDEDVEPRRAWP